mgnify:CR=1 FL=1
MTFDVGEHHAEFGLFKGHESYLFFLPCCGCDVIVSDDFVELIDVSPNDPPESDYVSTEGHELDRANFDFADNLPDSIIKDNPNLT